MNLLDALLLLSLLTVVFMYFYGQRRDAGWFGVAAYSIQLLMLAGLYGDMQNDLVLEAGLRLMVMDFNLSWGMSGIGWFFALITAGAALFASWFAAGDWQDSQKDMRIQHLVLALNVFSMLVLLCSQDFLSLFIGWELVSWASFFMMTHAGGKAADAAYRYLVYAMSGAMALFAAIVLIIVKLGSSRFEDFWAAIPTLPDSFLWLLVLLFFTGFSIKMAVLPFHLWQADAYAETPGANASFLSAISARMGLFALALVLLQPVGIERLHHLMLPLFSFIDARILLAWIAALTAIIPTYIALQQSDARLLLAWHGIGQGGLMLLGITVGTPLGVAGGLLHAFNYATYQAALFLAVTAVLYRTGTTDLDKLGGLITRMPWSYIVLLLGIIGLAGLPPMNGFVSKWLIYKSLLDQGMPMLLVAASISTLGTILSVYKLIHNIFLGQLRKVHYEVKEVPLSMLLPMLTLAILGFITGLMPGLALSLVDKAQMALGYAPLPHHLGGLEWTTGSLNMLWVVGILIYGIAIGAIIFYFFGNRRHITHQWDNYAGGHFLSADVPYHYSHNFYPGVMRVIGGWFRNQILNIEMGIRHFIQWSGELSYRFHQINHPALYLLMVTVLAMALIV